MQILSIYSDFNWFRILADGFRLSFSLKINEKTLLIGEESVKIGKLEE